MKTKIPLLVAAGLLLATITKAQYGGNYAENRLNIHGQIVIPARAEIEYNYNNPDQYHYDNRYDERREWRGDDNDRFAHEHRDWREGVYQRYCHEHREWRGDRNDFYRSYYGYRAAPYCAPRRVVVYGY